MAVIHGKHALLTLRLWRTFSTATGLPRPGTRCSRPPVSPGPPYDALVSVLQPMDPAELRFRADQLARVFTDRGVTYDFAGEERPFPLDLIPRVIDAVEWDLVARGVAAAGPRARGLPGRRLRRRARLRRRGDAVAAHLHLAALPPGGRRLHPAERRPGARGRHRPHPRRAGRVPRPGGQRSGAVRGQLRDREPAGHDAGRSPRCSPSRACTGWTSTRPGCWPRCAPPRRAGTADPCVVVLTPGVLQRRLLRAHPAGPADGRGAGGGPGPVLRPQPGLHAHHPGPAPGRRHLPPGRRRLPGPAAVPARLGDRLPGPDQRGPGRATSPSPTRSATGWPTTSSSTPTSPT